MHSVRLLLSVEVVKDFHLVTETDVGRVSQQTVHEFVKRSEYCSGESLCAAYSADHVCPSDFRLPFHISNPPISDPLIFWGGDKHPILLSDPLDLLIWPET